MFRLRYIICMIVFSYLTVAETSRASFLLQFTIPNSGSFNATQLGHLQEALDYSKNLWESVITGYQPDINISSVNVTIEAGSSFADALVTGKVNQGGFTVSTAGRVRINTSVIDTFASWDGSGPDNPDPELIGLNYLDDIIAHEVGHVIGIGTHWDDNGVYTNGTGQYTGQYGLTAYQQEFVPVATFVPVELAGSGGTMNSHWDQLMRSSSQEGDPNDPWSLSPLTGIVDQHGRDLALELMTGALDPDFGEPFLSKTTIQSLRDIGFAVVPEPTSLALLLMATFAIPRTLLRSRKLP